VDVSAHPGGASASAVFGFTGGNNIVLPFGELLLSGSRVFAIAGPSTGSTDVFQDNVPLDIALNGATVYTQAFSSGAGTTVAYNGVELTLGMY